jgi:hypothetical protein
LASRLITTFRYITKLISLYSPSFFFLTKNYRFLYSPLEYFSTPLSSYSLSIFTTNSNSGFRHRKFTAYYTLYSIVFIIIGSKTSLWIRLQSGHLNTKTFSLLISTSFKSIHSASYSLLILSSFICFSISYNCLRISENLNSIYY